ncbi:kinase-like domain-containing protein [Rhizophagus irregularis DAOM 181602=DAOM 197198]|nr:kinase-like domain-containing protein [Rhizophagus irregularis DAOM 181602=DAOM 197198]
MQYGLCEICKQPKTDFYYCRLCKSQYFQQNFKNWTSGNHDVDEFIQKAQLKAERHTKIIEWIEYDKFDDVEYLAKGGFGTTFEAVWKDGPWNKYNQLERKGETKVALKCLHNSQDITADFLKEVESNILACYTDFIVRCFGITKDPKTNNFIMVMELKNGSLRQYLNNNFILLDWNQKLWSLYCIAVEPKNANNNDDLHGIEYSDSLKMDFTKLNINSKDENN